MELRHRRRLEGLLHSVNQAIGRKRKGLTLHPDELPAIRDALDAVIRPLIDEELRPLPHTNPIAGIYPPNTK